MLEILAEVIKTFISLISDKLSVKAPGSEKAVCRELWRLNVVMEELSQQATAFYQSFGNYLMDEKNGADSKRNLRDDLRELLDALKRYEKRVKQVFVLLKLIDDSDLSIRLVEVPESSFMLFKKYFVDDLAPKAIADRSGSKYVIRVTRNMTAHTLVDINQLGHLSLDLARLFKEGHLSYEVVDLDDKENARQFLEEFLGDILKLDKAVDSLKAIIRQRCDPGELL